MPSIIDMLSDKPAVILLLEAIAKSDPDMKCIPDGPGGRGKESKVEIKVTINGQEVDFEAAIQKGVDNLLEQYHEAVKEAAREMLRGTALGNLVCELERAEWKITEALALVTGTN